MSRILECARLLDDAARNARAVPQIDPEGRLPLADSGRCGKSPHHWTHRHSPKDVGRELWLWHRNETAPR